jgi:hypothetical protein
LGENECVVQYRDSINLRKSIDRALNERALCGSGKIESRRKYFDKWFGQIDGSENVRLKKILIDLVSRSDFQEVLKTKGNKQTRYLECLLE